MPQIVFPLQHKTVVVTGGTSGIGYELVKQLTLNNRVVVIARPGPKLDALAAEFGQVSVYAADLSNLHECEGVANWLLKQYPNIDVLLNNAAVQYPATMLDDQFNFESIDYEINLNLTCVCALTYLLLPALQEAATKSYIVNMNSALALAPKTGSAVYCATKAAVNSFSQSLGYQLAGTTIKVTQVFLPLVDTPMTEGRGRNKISAAQAATQTIKGIELGRTTINIGKVKLLRVLFALAPLLARRILRAG
ncbi:SDR family NAD(P)-dependent oxidoreductase [Gilvimarinus sp. SDUM040013]|uniref:SDR family NAD(P)-dependent oxidoreductase n=1 Tax=Gilvimarinus gilvus TaxID=3058038 RepID=A0ABU4S313_9GAMM|nr:SDR family NAD(P)-dependent oxidoreductase [Gilvimarinus sp. SDUM040013]MDO3384790.1 SDR family NAD(P)-dependent oxidoreductase [Gilvimarinus sp. SDUM040013]MDX6850877.1 SDR family NAD(P)-dependent oxidoreductase [Gilvimarinus sp. SDUM040013]